MTFFNIGSSKSLLARGIYTEAGTIEKVACEVRSGALFEVSQGITGRLSWLRAVGVNTFAPRGAPSSARRTSLFLFNMEEDSFVLSPPRTRLIHLRRPALK